MAIFLKSFFYIFLILGFMSPVLSETNKLIVENLRNGKGKEAKKFRWLKVHYTGWLKDGKKFDSSYDRKSPFRFQLGVGQVIRGWDRGLRGMKVGGKRKLTIPSHLAYGQEGTPSIPPNSTLVFEIELLDVSNIK